MASSSAYDPKRTPGLSLPVPICCPGRQRGDEGPGNVCLTGTLKSMGYRKYLEFQAMQMRRRDGLHWDKGSTFLLSGALLLLLFAFVFYDRPLINNPQIFAYLRGLTASLDSPNPTPLF